MNGPRSRSVRMRPGSTVFTVIWSGASSSASVLASPATPARRLLDRTRPGIGSFTALEATLMIRPLRLARRCGKAARTIRTTLSSSRSKAFCQAASSKLSNAPPGGPPLLLTRTSNPPKRATAVATRCSAAPALATSAATGITSAWYVAAICVAAAVTAASSREEMTRRAPSAASASAMPRPMPRLAALTSATRPRS